MITLTNEQQNSSISGLHGTYLKLSPSVGVKIIHSPTYRSKSKAYLSRAFRRAREESDTLQYAYETGVVPRCYGAVLVKVKSGFRVGVLMQHLGTLTLSNSEFYDCAAVYYDIKDKLRELGIFHNDLHDDNIMVYRGKCYAIDFAPECVTVK